MFSYKYTGMHNFSPTSFPSSSDNFTHSSFVTLATGIIGHTSVAPILGCSPFCRDMSIRSDAVDIALNAASFTWSGSPAKVITVLL